MDVPLFGGAACAVGALAHGAYDLVAGDDIKTLQDRHASGVDKFLAVVDLTSNLLVFVPIGGEGIEAAKLAAKAALKLGSRGIVKEVSYEGAVQIVKRLGRRGARGAVEGAAEACAKSGLVYNVVAKGRAFLLTIVVGSNGFIVTAYPSS